MGSIPGSGRSPGVGNGNPNQYSCLENPMDRGAGQATVHGVAKSLTQLKQLSMHQFSSVTQSCSTLCNPMNRSMPGIPVHHQLPDITDSTDMSLSKLREIVKDREARHAAVHGVAKSRT